MASCLTVPSCARHTEGRTRSRNTRRFRPCPHVRRVADDGSRWRGPGPLHGFKCRPSEWVRRLGACCRCVSLHHGLGLWPAAYKDVARVFVHLPAAPLDVVIPITASVPSCSEPSRTSLRWALTRPSLTASARAGNADVQVGTKKRLPGRTKKPTDEKMDRTLAAPP